MPSVLIVEDDIPLAEIWRDALVLEGYEVSLTHTGVEAAELLKGKRFNAVITDFNMPDGGGMYVSGMVRLLQGHNNIIVVSGFVSQSLAGRSRREALSGIGVKKILMKPIDIDVLIQEVSTAVENGL